MIRNKIRVCFFLEDGCRQEDDEASAHWEPINFQIYNNLFLELVQDVIDQWLLETLSHLTPHTKLFFLMWLTEIVQEQLLESTLYQFGRKARTGKHITPRF